MQLTIPKSDLEQLILIEPKLIPWIEKLPPLERPGTADLFEAIISSIISQQISTKAAVTIKNRLQEKAGSITPLAVARLSREEIQALGMSFRKAGYLEAITERVVSGALHLDELSSFSDERVIEELVALPGIGPWTAEMLLIFSLGRTDVLSIDDLGIKRGVERVFGLESADKKFLRELKTRFSPFGTSAGLLFWQVAGLSKTELEDWNI